MPLLKDIFSNYYEDVEDSFVFFWELLMSEDIHYRI